jgi:hypothetical protein
MNRNFSSAAPLLLCLIRRPARRSQRRAGRRFFLNS